MRMHTEKFSAATFRARATSDNGDVDWRQYGDHRLNRDIADRLAEEKLRDAAVLVPLVDHGDRTGMLLTQRTQSMRTHSGQIAFPGGAVDREDASIEAAAMREAEEEIGLSPSLVEAVGRLPDYLTISGFRVVPVLAVVREEYSLSINREEVDDAFEVPFDFLMDPTNHRRESRFWDGKERHYYTMPYKDRFIWGVTAGILRTLYERHYA